MHRVDEKRVRVVVIMCGPKVLGCGLMSPRSWVVKVGPREFR